MAKSTDGADPANIVQPDSNVELAKAAAKRQAAHEATGGGAAAKAEAQPDTTPPANRSTAQSRQQRAS